MKVKAHIEVDIDFKQAIDVLKEEAEQIAYQDFDDLIVKGDTVYYKEESLTGKVKEKRADFNFSEDEDFVIAIINLVEAYKRFVGEDR